MNGAFWRNLGITVVLAGLAAYAGARLSEQPLPAGPKPAAAPRGPVGMRDSVYQMVHQDIQLSDDQKHRIDDIEARYAHRRNELRAKIASANAELGEALANEMALGTAASRALEHQEQDMGDLQRETILYVLEVRAVLTPKQQQVLDQKVFEVPERQPIELTGAETEPDAELVRRARGGDQRAFSLLMGRHKHWVYRFVRRYVGDADEAYDVTQDAFVAAMSNLHRYDPERPFETWLRRIALNKCRDKARRESVRRAFGLSRRGPEETEQVADPAAGADQALAAGSALKALDQAIAALPASLKEPLVLTTLEGLSQKEAAAVLGLSTKAVEVRVYRAKRQLAEMLDREHMSELLED